VQLSAFTDYSLRVLIYVGLRPEARVAITEVAAAHGISRNHVVKVVQRLAELGYLSTFRGRGGGIELAHEPASIRVGAVVKSLENLQLVECFKPDGACAIAGPCVLQRALGEAVAAFFGVLDGYTLDDLLRPRSRLRRALALS
jgi:Rrf2 family nitric oxide-sensitive transcriptional repressor